MTFSDKAIEFFNHLKTPKIKLDTIDIINPYSDKEVRNIVSEFYKKFYNDNNSRIFIIGINPGRFGGGLTGICFTDPVALREECGIENSLGHHKELSSKFIYSLVRQFGGAEKFFSKAYLTALFPFALTKQGKNFNYYDDDSLANSLKPIIVRCLKMQIEFGARKDLAVILGKKNAKFFMSLNNQYKFFEKIIVFEHPRYIMQYKLRKVGNYINDYIEALK
jgi:hypothetical protein